MDRIKKISANRLASTRHGFTRYMFQVIDWEQRLIMILGQRGTGKTTMLLQRMKGDDAKSIYLSLDDIHFETERLIHTVESLYEEGYRHFYLDEVHRYQFWSKDLKIAYDNYPDARFIVTGSSILEISKGSDDLSRRAVVHFLPGLSFREYIGLKHGISFNSLKLEAILKNHHEIAAGFHDRIDIMKAFSEYLKTGYYPFFNEGLGAYPQKLHNVINLVLDLDIAPYEELHYTSVRNMKKLLSVISQSVPFKPNIASLADTLDIPRNSILKLLDLLDRAGIISLLRSDTGGVSYLRKPEKIYIQNTNLIWMLSGDKPETGNIRETFFLNQISNRHQVTSSRWADFMVDGVYTFEIGGPGKTNRQIRDIPNSFIAADGIKGGSGNKIPLWLFGFMY